MDGIYLNSVELDGLSGASGLAVKLYLCMREWVDFRTGLVGIAQALSLGKLMAYGETYIRRGKGWQIDRPTREEVRGALRALARAGLLERVKSEVLVFRMPRMRAHPHAQNKPPTMAPRGSAQATPAPMPEAARVSRGYPHRTAQGRKTANPPYIRDQGKPSTPQAASTTLTGVDAPPKKDADPACQRTHTLATLIRQCGGVVFEGDATVRQWVADGVEEDDVRQAAQVAQARRRHDGSHQPINPGYLNAILRDSRRNGPPGKPGGKAGLAAGWWRSAAAMSHKARELGIADARPGESSEDFRLRIALALERQVGAGFDMPPGAEIHAGGLTGGYVGGRA